MDDINKNNLISNTCSACRQTILPQYNFCPNCGAKLISTPLSTTIGTQAWIYAFSIILPLICFILIGKWPGTKYFKSKDPKAEQIGWIAWILLILSTIITFWLAIIWTQEMIQAATSSLNFNIGI